MMGHSDFKRQAGIQTFHIIISVFIEFVVINYGVLRIKYTYMHLFKRCWAGNLSHANVDFER